MGGRPWSLFWRSIGRTNLSLTRRKPAASRRIRRQRIPYTRRTKRERRMNENDDCENITNAKCFALSLSHTRSPLALPKCFGFGLCLSQLNSERVVEVVILVSCLMSFNSRTNEQRCRAVGLRSLDVRSFFLLLVFHRRSVGYRLVGELD